MSKSQVILVVVVGCVLLAVANVSLWATRDLFNSGRFGKLVVQGLQSEGATEALGILVADYILPEDTVVSRVARSAAEEVSAWFLQRPAFAPVLEKAAGAADTILTTNVDDVVNLDVEQVVPFVLSVVKTVDPELGARLESVADSGPLALLGPDELPRLRQAARVLPWLWPLAAIGAIALFAVAYWRAKVRRDALTFIGFGAMITGVVQLLFIPAARVAVENNVLNASVRVIVGEVVEVFMNDFLVQTVALIVIGLVVLAASRFLPIAERGTE